MKKLFSLFMLTVLFTLNSFSQLSLKLAFPKCDIANSSVLSETKDNKMFMITKQEEFDKYFKIMDGTNINFENSVALVAILGTSNADKYLYIDAANFVAENRRLNIRWDYKNDYFRDVNSNNPEGKYCVAVIRKMEYKKILFLKGRAYSFRQGYRD